MNALEKRELRLGEAAERRKIRDWTRSVWLFPRRVAQVTLALILACGAPGVFATAVLGSPGATSFNLGEFRITVLRDGALVFPNDGSIFATNASPAAVSKVLRDAGASPDTIQLDIDTLLIQMAKHVVMLDAGYGVTGKSVVRDSLGLVGVSPNDVTDVLITHAHPDHVGGLVDTQGHLAFPKATIWMSAKEWAFMQTEDDVRAEVPVIKAKVKTFEVGKPVLPGITPVVLSGHTPGHVGYEIVSQGHKLIDIGDMAHNAIISLARPEWTLAWDSDKPQAARTRREELQQLANTRELMFAPHFPYPGVGRIEQAGRGFSFLPDQPAGK